MKVYLLCGGYYKNFDYPKPFVVINGERLIDRTTRLLSEYSIAPIICCNTEEHAFDDWNPLRCNFTYNHLDGTGYYLDIFDAVEFDEPCIFLFGDVYYTKFAMNKIIEKFNETDRNIFICNQYPFNQWHLRQGEPFGWIVKDVEEFKAAILLGKRFQDRGIVQDIRQKLDHGGIPTNWELAHIINGLAVNDFCLRQEDCLVIDDATIDVDDPKVISIVEDRVRGSN